MNAISISNRDMIGLKNVQVLLIYTTALSLVLSIGTVYTHIRGFEKLDVIVTYLPVITLTILLFTKQFYTRSVFYRTIQTAICLLVYLSIFAVVSGSNLTKALYQIVLLVVFLLYVLLFENQGTPYLFIAYRNIITTIAGISIVLWILGPVLELIPSYAVSENWGLSGTGLYRTIKGYFGLQFAREETYIFGRLIISNRSIFVERAFAAYSFALGWIYELFIEKNKSRKRIIVLSVAILTTFSMTGLILLIIISMMRYIFTGKNQVIVKLLKIAFIPVAVVVVISSIQYLLNEKMSMGHSAVSRMADLNNGIAAWLNRPLTGYGFGNGAEIQRLFSTGYSNSITSVLCQGGIMLMSLFVICFAKGIYAGIKNKNMNYVLFTISFLLFFASTVIAFRNITVYVLLFSCFSLLKVPSNNYEEVAYGKRNCISNNTNL